MKSEESSCLYMCFLLALNNFHVSAIPARYHRFNDNVEVLTSDKGYSATNGEMLITFGPLIMRLYKTLSHTPVPYENIFLETTVVNNDLAQDVGTRDDEAVGDETVISNNQYKYTNGRDGDTASNDSVNNNTWQRVNSRQQLSVSETKRTGGQQTSDVERIPDTSTDKTDIFEPVYKRRYIDCDITKITLNMVMEYLKTGKVCGTRTSPVRFGLGK